MSLYEKASSSAHVRLNSASVITALGPKRPNGQFHLAIQVSLVPKVSSSKSSPPKARPANLADSADSPEKKNNLNNSILLTLLFGAQSNVYRTLCSRCILACFKIINCSLSLFFSFRSGPEVLGQTCDHLAVQREAVLGETPLQSTRPQHLRSKADSRTNARYDGNGSYLGGRAPAPKNH